MKKLFLVILCLFAICLMACGSDIEKETDSQEMSMFVIVEDTNIWSVVYHKETKVMYVVSRGSRNAGTFTLLVDENGKPLLWEGR